MKIYLLFGLLAVVVLAGLSTHFLFNEPSSDSNSDLIPVQGAGLEMMLDEETGEMVTDPKKLDKLMALKKKPARKEKPKIVMTEMDDGAIKVDLGRRYIKPRSATVDENGNFINHGHTEFAAQEAE